MNRWIIIALLSAILVYAGAPSMTSVSISATTIDNADDDNLTATFIGVSDPDSDSVKNLTDWSIDGTSMAVLNIPFENTSPTFTKDFSTYGNDGTVVGTTFN